jgi:UDP-N-acetyl-D-glucosamine/UDP-N-acetyl-D-galactosamine dehydrogenase
MGAYVASQVMGLMAKRRIHIKGSRILVLGLAFKENCPDLRNSKVVDVIGELRKFDARVEVYDPWVSGREAHSEYGIRPVRALRRNRYDAVVLAVGHDRFKSLGSAAIRRLCRRNHVFYDIKYTFPAAQSDGRL